jgi:hypothetical protein
VFLTTDRRAWWMFSLVVIPAHLLSHGPRGVPPLIMFVQFTGNAGLALLTALAISHLVDEPRRFDRLRTMTLFILLGGLAAALGSLVVAALFSLLL